MKGEMMIEELKAALPAWLVAKAVPGMWSELLTLPDGAEYKEVEGVLCVSCPDRPDFWFGNFIMFNDRRFDTDAASLLEIWKTSLGKNDRVEKIVLISEVPVGEPLPKDLPHGFAVEDSSVLVYADGLATERVNHNFPFKIEMVKSREQFEKIVALAPNLGFNQSGVAPPEFIRWRLRAFWELVELKRAKWWAVWDGDQVVGYSGMFVDDGLVRCPEVVTRDEYRNRGVCTQLCLRMLTYAFSVGGATLGVQIAEPGGAAERIYRSVGATNFSTFRAFVADP
jgi:RimJ/RimL family protein N-acetyltransferase